MIISHSELACRLIKVIGQKKMPRITTFVVLLPLRAFNCNCSCHFKHKTSVQLTYFPYYFSVDKEAPSTPYSVLAQEWSTFRARHWSSTYSQTGRRDCDGLAIKYGEFIYLWPMHMHTHIAQRERHFGGLLPTWPPITRIPKTDAHCFVLRSLTVTQPTPYVTSPTIHARWSETRTRKKNKC